MYVKSKKCTLKCHRCNRIGHRVKNCTIPKRNRNQAGSTKVLGTVVPEPAKIRQITSVWDEFPTIARPERADHVTSVWDEVEDIRGDGPLQQGFPTPRQKLQKAESETSSGEEWFDAMETQGDGRTWDMESTTEWENFPETEISFEEPQREEEPVLAPHEMEQQFLAERWEEVHFVFRGWNIEPCKTRKQNPKYHDSFFICGQMNHHSHWFCTGCKTMAYVYRPGAKTPCNCEF